ncbi:MAG: 4-alpha-glucanotransferase [Candidatus Cloacimonetes bacterium]|nr:4-alpha-glucanotransferase [Candidatus Cloacimonadota bacterium]
MSKNIPRSSGILLHITSLPNKYGIGSLGKEAREFIDFLEMAGQKVWQVCPIGPTGYGESPYAMYSSFAGNPLFIDLEMLLEDGLIMPKHLEDAPYFEPEYVDYPAVHQYKENIYRLAFDKFKGQTPADYNAFINKESFWLDDYALFRALKNKYNGKSWLDWDAPQKAHQPEAMAKAEIELKDEILYQKFLQYIFFQQWGSIKNYANDKGVLIIGDIPIYPSLDSADVWSQPHLFQLNADMQPLAVAGCPPDDFSEDGQLWGNPLYDWAQHEKEGYNWWVERFRSLCRLVDIIRIDHFLGFEHYWSVPYGAPTAATGKWQPGPSHKIFQAVEDKLGELPIIAEDLGAVSPAVEKLRDDFEYPGMKILHFAFGTGEDNPYLPHNFTKNCVVYTGTHDNETTVGWYNNLPEHIKVHVRSYLSYLNFTDWQVSWKMIEAALDSKALIAIAPLQDYLGLDNSARFNTPGTIENNWRWRFLPTQLNPDMAAAIKSMVVKAGR